MYHKLELDLRKIKEDSYTCTASVAQLVEHRAVTREVVSSTPAGPTFEKSRARSSRYCGCPFFSSKCGQLGIKYVSKKACGV